MRAATEGLIDAVALLVSVRDANPDQLAEEIDQMLTSEHVRECVGWLLLLDSARLRRKEVKHLAHIVAATVAEEEGFA